MSCRSACASCLCAHTYVCEKKGNRASEHRVWRTIFAPLGVFAAAVTGPSELLALPGTLVCLVPIHSCPVTITELLRFGINGRYTWFVSNGSVVILTFLMKNQCFYSKYQKTEIMWEFVVFPEISQQCNAAAWIPGDIALYSSWHCA